jgi:hypothetical protein
MEENSSPLRPSIVLKGYHSPIQIKGLVSEVKDVDC